MNNAEIKVLLKLKDEMSGALQKVGNVTKDVGGKMIDIFKIGVVGAVGAVSGALAKAGWDALDFSRQSDKALGNFQAQLGITQAHAENLTQVATDVWANNFGDSLADTAEAITLVNKNIGEFDDLQELQNTTEDVFRLRDAFDLDLNESTRAANSLMENFGLTSQQSFDFITTGMQKGLNANGDFLDSIGEYSNQFSDMNSTADEFFSVLETGMGGGILGTDKIADSMKEFNVNLNDLGKNDAFTALGVDQKKLAKEVANGTKSGAKLYQELFEKISAIEDPVERNTLATEIFGTQMEDLTDSMVEGLDVTKTSLEDMAGTTDALNVQYQDFGSMMGSLWRNIVIEIQPFTDKLLELAGKVVPVLIDVVGKTVEIIGQLATKFSEFINSEGVQMVLAELKRMGEEIMVELKDSFEKMQPSIEMLIEFLVKLFKILAPIAAFITGVLVVAIFELIKVFLNVAEVVLPILIKVFVTWYDTLLNIAIGVYNFGVGVYNTIKDMVDKAGAAINGFKDGVSSAFETIKNAIVGPVESARDTIVEIVDKIINKIQQIIDKAKSVPDAVGGFLDDLNPTTGSGFLSGIKIPGFAEGADFTVPQGYKNDSFIMGVQEGEHVKVTPANEVSNSTDNSRSIGQIIINNTADNFSLESLLQELAI